MSTLTKIGSKIHRIATETQTWSWHLGANLAFESLVCIFSRTKPLMQNPLPNFWNTYLKHVTSKYEAQRTSTPRDYRAGVRLDENCKIWPKSAPRPTKSDDLSIESLVNSHRILIFTCRREKKRPKKFKLYIGDHTQYNWLKNVYLQIDSATINNVNKLFHK